MGRSRATTPRVLGTNTGKSTSRALPSFGPGGSGGDNRLGERVAGLESTVGHLKDAISGLRGWIIAGVSVVLAAYGGLYLVMHADIKDVAKDTTLMSTQITKVGDSVEAMRVSLVEIADGKNSQPIMRETKRPPEGSPVVDPKKP